MTPDFVAGIVIETLKTIMYLAGPILTCGLIAGLLVSIFQSATQINEMTLVFIPKMLAVGLAIIFLFPWMMRIMIDFAENIFVNIPQYVK